MHRTALLFSAICFMLAVAAAVFLANRSADYVERHATHEVESALLAAGQNWATIRPDGLIVNLTGLAPDEAGHLRAIEIMGEVIDAGRIVDLTSVLQSSDIVVPRFSLEMLRNVDRISLIGLIPEKQSRDAILERAQEIAGQGTVTDMLESAEHDIPEGWVSNLGFGLDSLEQLPLSKISITPKIVQVTAVTESLEDQKRLEQVLATSKPDGTKLIMDISAPRPVIAPFQLRMSIADGVANLSVCSADTRDTRQRILRAAINAGHNDKASCQIGLGVPTTDWAKAVVMSIEALDELGGGSLTFTDSDIALIAVDTTKQAQFDRTIGRLENALPDLFSLHAILPPKILTDGEKAEADPPEFVATRSPEGLVQLRGRIQNQTSKDSISVFAAALFGREVVHNQTRLDKTLPDGWPTRVLAGIEGLAALHHGSVTVQPDLVVIKGISASPDIPGEISRLFSIRMGGKENYEINVAYDEKLDVQASAPSGEECEQQISAVLTDQQIVFAPSSTKIEAASQGVLDAIAEIVRECPETEFEIEGHTDSQGSEELNKNLSQARAEAVLSALLSRRILISGLVAKGYGEENPIADNKTEEGRAQNRRIAFRLLNTEEPTDEQN
ncbi:MAG: OmpA family protein [Rhodobacteraceae bacterium]|nr:OmpA family protein [Paracoccaceae bacterium]